MSQYHVIKKNGLWELYVGHGTTVLASSVEQAAVVRAARALARQNGGKVAIHKEQSPEVDSADATAGGLGWPGSGQTLESLWDRIAAPQQSVEPGDDRA